MNAAAGSHLQGCRVSVLAHGGGAGGARREEAAEGLAPIKELFHSIKLIEGGKTAKGQRSVQCPRLSTARQSDQLWPPKLPPKYQKIINKKSLFILYIKLSHSDRWFVLSVSYIWNKWTNQEASIDSPGLKAFQYKWKALDSVQSFPQRPSGVNQEEKISAASLWTIKQKTNESAQDQNHVRSLAAQLALTGWLTAAAWLGY